MIFFENYINVRRIKVNEERINKTSKSYKYNFLSWAWNNWNFIFCLAHKITYKCNFIKMEKEIDISGKKVVVKEISYLDSLEIAELRDKEGLKAAIAKQMELSTNLSKEEVEKLTMKEGATIQKIVNELNLDLENFQSPTE